MKIPSSIRIGAVDYPIVVVDEIDEGHSIGEFRRDERRIEMVDMSASVNANTLLHEVLHACYTNAALDATKTGIKMEEPVVTGLTNQLVGVIRDNPAFVKWLQKAVKG